MSAENKPMIFSLSQVAGAIARKLKEVSSVTYWVQAEIGDVSDKGGNYYGALVETKDGAQVAKLKFRIWKRDRERIAAAFRKAELQFQLKSGMKVILQCHLDFHALYGLSLVVTDADPRFILGELEMRKREIIKRLLEAGEDRKNKRLAVPRLPMRIGLITSKESAAYYDVYRTLQAGGFAYRVSFADATMQGEQTEASLLRGLQLFERLEVDLVIIVRGGGNKTDLATLDSERLALAIAAYGKPVWVAIGHETDSGVLDLVAHTTFKTPTALAEEIVSRFEKARIEVAEAERRIRQIWRYFAERERTRIEKDSVGIVQGSRKTAELARSELRNAMEHLRRAVGERTAVEHRAVSLHRDAIRSIMTRRTTEHAAFLRASAQSVGSRAAQLLRNAQLITSEMRKRMTPERVQLFFRREWDDILRSARVLSSEWNAIVQQRAERQQVDLSRLKSSRMLDRLQHEHSRLDDRLRNTRAYDPRKALERGYTITTNAEGEILKSIDAVTAGLDLRIEFSDGRADAIVSRKERHNE